MTTSPVHRQPRLTALLLSMVASMGDHQGHSALPTAGARCECFRWMRVGDGRCPNSFRATGDNSTAYAGSFGDYNTATAQRERRRRRLARSHAARNRQRRCGARRAGVRGRNRHAHARALRVSHRSGADGPCGPADGLEAERNRMRVALEEQLADAERSRRNQMSPSERRALADIRSVERDSMTGVRSCPALASTGWPISAVAAAPTPPPNARETAHTLRRDLGDSERRAVMMPARDVMLVRGGHARLFLLTSTAPECSCTVKTCRDDSTNHDEGD